MKVSVKKVDAVRRQLALQIPKDRVKAKLDEVFNDIMKVAKIKGFRPGKAPRHLVEAQHGAAAREEALKKLIPETYREALDQEKLSPIDMPDITDVKFQDGELSYVAAFDIKPEVTVKDYRGIKVKRKNSDVTEEDIEKTMDYFRQSQGMDEKAPIDDAFAKGLGYPSLAEFKQSLSRQMAMDKEQQARHDVENQIVEALLKNSKLTVPQSLVKKQLDHRLHEAKHRLEHQGLSPDEIGKREEEIRKDLQAPVEKDVKVYLILDKIAELENITVKDGESLPRKAMEFLMREAEWGSAGKSEK